MRYQQLGWKFARVLFGLFFICSTMVILIQFGGQHPPEAVIAAGRFTNALNESGFINPSLIMVFLVGGVAMLFDRSAPIGLILLGAPVFVIAGFHWFLTQSYIWGSIWPLWFTALVWHYRYVFSRLWKRSSQSD